MLRSFLALVLVSAACSKTPPAQPPTPPVTQPPPPPAPAKVTFPNVPSTPVGDQLAWVFDLLAHRQGKVDKAEVEAHFDPSFLAKVPAEQLVGVLAQVAAKATDLTVGEAKGDDTRLVARTSAGGQKFLTKIAIDATSKKIVGLLFQPDDEMGPKPASYDEAKQMMSALAPRTSLLVAEVTKGACKPVFSIAPGDELAIGSTMKLYVLLGLADKVIAGKAKWEDELAVRDDWKSLPSGVTQDDAAGTKLSLQTLAERMISISDNSATDHLLYYLGRKQVEAAVRAAKHSKPALDTPFASTREFFDLKLESSQDERDAYVKMSEAKRRDHLDKTLAQKMPALDKANDWKTARAVDKIEWFASGNDLCNVMATLWQRGQNPKAKVLLDVLSKNPGLPIDKAQFPYIGFKGGSEPGVISMTYLLKRADDKLFVVSSSFNAAEDGGLDEGKVVGVIAGIIEVLGKDGKPGDKPAEPKK